MRAVSNCRRLGLVAAVLVGVLLSGCGGTGRDSARQVKRARQTAVVGTRLLPGSYAPGGSLLVMLIVDPPTGTRACSLDESLPAGWRLIAASHDGVEDSASSKVTWAALPASGGIVHYTVRVPVATRGDQALAGHVTYDGRTEVVGGSSTLAGPTGQHQADTDGDGRIGINEVTTLIGAWKQGQFDNINLVTNAIALWKGGETYHYDASASPPYLAGPAGATTDTGSLTVQLGPQEACSAGARWRVDDDPVLHEHLATVTGLSIGSHTVHFTAASGYTTPADETVPVVAGQTARAAGLYLAAAPTTGAVQVTMAPAAAVAAGARWTIDGSATAHASGDTVSGLTPGPHTVSCSQLAGYRRPADQTVVVVAGQTAAVTATYLAAPVSGLAASVWPKYQGDARNSGLSSTDGAPATGILRWSWRTSYVNGSAIAANGTVLVGAVALLGLSPTYGTADWASSTWGTPRAAPVVGADQTVYMVSAGLEAIDGATHKRKWLIRKGHSTVAAPAIGADGTVYFGCDGDVLAVNGATGADRWRFATGGEVAAPTVGSDGTVYVGSTDWKLYALNGATGALKWKFATANRVYTCPALGDDGTVYLGADAGFVYALDGATGAEKWRYEIGRPVTSVALGADGTAYVGAADNCVYALDGVSGNLRWSAVTGGPVRACPAIGADGTVYVTSQDTRVYAFHGRTGRQKWAVKLPTGASETVALTCAPTVAHDGTVIVSDNTFVYGLQ